jgi:hypothetical protein
MIIESWRHRYERPIWSDSILPYIFHGRRFESQDSGPLHQSDPAENEPGALWYLKDTNPLLSETSQMTDAAKGTMVIFRWTGTLHNRNMTREQALQQENVPLRPTVQAKVDRQDNQVDVTLRWYARVAYITFLDKQDLKSSLLQHS